MQPKTVVRVEAEEPAKRLAVLIDADNAQAGVIEGLLEEIARFGEATVKRIYGDFTSPNSASWKKVLNRHSIKPVQQFAYTTGKNATDSTMIIDAMDLLYTRRFDGYCLVTSEGLDAKSCSPQIALCHFLRHKLKHYTVLDPELNDIKRATGKLNGSPSLPTSQSDDFFCAAID